MHYLQLPKQAMDLKSHQFIKFFEPEQAEELSARAIIETFSDHVVIFEEGEVSDYLYLVLDGTVLFRKHTINDHYQIVAQANSDDFFGEFGILDGKPRSAQAMVCEGATLAKFPRNVLIDILNNTKGETVLHLFNFIIQRLRTTTEEFVKQVTYKDKMVLLGEMVNTIIHDFKSPLSSINLSSSMLREMYENDEDTIEWCELIQQQSIRMAAMAEELLEFSRGSAHLRKQDINLAAALHRFEKLNRIYFAQANVAFVLSCPESLTLEADENKLMRALQNLVVNAVEALDDEGGEIGVTVTTGKVGVTIAIQDNGPGIPLEIRETFFEAFVTYGKKRGTGLGTAIAKSIIDAHQGQIRFETEVGQGTTFFIQLPFQGSQFL
ncbi:ATP-binding protein [Spirulina major CS-329]|nr:MULTISPECIES: ATP-binding protein [Spirulina]MDB9496468.1 ATP-binding protein [Spirulina subsalsa CS-330]MDB9502682.1 ATP-binding protein [Spirulina major CS-329]